MKRYELWAGARCIRDYTRKGDALNAWARRITRTPPEENHERVFVVDAQDDYKIIIDSEY